MPIVALSTRTLPPNKFRLHPVPMLNLVYHPHRNLILLLFPFPDNQTGQQRTTMSWSLSVTPLKAKKKPAKHKRRH